MLVFARHRELAANAIGTVRDPVREWRGVSREEAWQQYIGYLIQTLRSNALPTLKK